ncbi:hypothetical protein CYMTET_10439 [Cymbomonas tetramitiformis]|uniref:Uncharacterized protein n=1 Tax=Cymbomonas tetramitiformis TaxID=36881 RepID=A0AAE0LE11_9CHLO|nr:hypothetical protein CYMTET_10439 [Cymbomonas tetramitiformis]
MRNVSTSHSAAKFVAACIQSLSTGSTGVRRPLVLGTGEYPKWKTLSNSHLARCVTSRETVEIPGHDGRRAGYRRRRTWIPQAPRRPRAWRAGENNKRRASGSAGSQRAHAVPHTHNRRVGAAFIRQGANA